jgi:hypothetical protein
MNTGRSMVVTLSLYLLLGIAPSMAAQSSAAVASSTATGAQAIPDEITLTGTIQQVVSDPAPRQPQGVHLIVASPQGLFDVSAGPYLAKDVKDSLSSGQPVQVTGVLRTFNGQRYLLVREMNVAGRQVTVRNQHGFPVHAQSSGATRSTRSRAGVNGGIQ